MKIRAVLFFILIPVFCRAQDEPDNTIKVITTLHEDGTRTVTKTDPEQHSSEAIKYGAGDKVLQRIVYQLDEENQPSTGTVYGSNGAVIMKTAYKHDSSNRVTEEDDYTEQGELLRRFIYEFGADGKVSRIRAFDGNGNELHQTAAPASTPKVPPRRHR